jgi:two-component system sensor histidine kinase TctE
VDNAVKYTPAGGTVTIRCGPAAGLAAAGGAESGQPRSGVFLEVEDDGPGIAPHERAKALQRFYRVLGTVGEGNGLGLAIASEIARVHHSQLELGDGGTPALGPRGLRVRLSL